MQAPLTLRSLAPIYALSGSPHPDKPQIPAGKAAVILAENARLPLSGPAPPAFPPAGGASVSGTILERHSFFPISDLRVEAAPERARLRQKIREEIL